jgi:hypothetical protein
MSENQELFESLFGDVVDVLAGEDIPVNITAGEFIQLLSDEIDKLKMLKHTQRDKRLTKQQEIKVNRLQMHKYLNEFFKHIDRIESGRSSGLFSLATAAYLLGVHRGVDYGYEGTDESLAYLYSLKMSELSSESRQKGHEKWQQKFEKAMKKPLEEAERLWAEGEEMRHNQMAEHIFKKYKALRSIPPKNVNVKKRIRKNLIPIAEKFGKISGIKKKQSLEPSR